jgi:23S rRNA (cytosine1962-C5)-methyltransferase
MQALFDAISQAQPGTDACRVFHGRGGLHPGCEALALDYFEPVFLLTSFEPLAEETLVRIDQALAQRWAQLRPETDLNWVYQCRHEGRTQTRLMAGQVPDPHVVSEGAARYRIHLLKGQNHGLFLDMAQGRAWVRRHVERQPGLRVLNLFAYTGAFSVVALQAGAKQVINVDMSAGAMSLGQINHQLNSVAKGASFWVHDIFNSWGKISRHGPYDLLIVDPPSFQKGSFVATKDYARVLRRLPDLLSDDGHVLLCLNAPELSTAFLTDQVHSLAPTLRLVERVANPTIFADVDPERALKVLHYALAQEAVP